MQSRRKPTRHPARLGAATWVAALALGSTPATAAEQRIRLIEAPTGEFLNDAVTTGALALGPDDLVLASGETLAVVKHTPLATEVQVLGADGGLLWKTSLPPGTAAELIGSSLACYQTQDTPGFPYRLELRSARGARILERAGRKIVDVRSLEQHLALTSIPAGKGASETDVLDADGHTVWRFSDADRRIPRVVVRGGLAAALYTGTPDSLLVLAERAPGRSGSLEIPGATLDDVAFLAGKPRLLAWGSGSAALVETEPLRLRWNSPLPGALEPLHNETSAIAAGKREVVLAACDGSPLSDCRASLLRLDLDNGDVLGVQPIPGEPRSLSAGKRYQRGLLENLVLNGRLYELQIRRADR